MKLNINNEREKLSTRYKKLWDIEVTILDNVAREQNLSEQEREMLLQTQMATLRIADLKGQNEYNRRSGDAFAKKAIKKNEADISKMERVYNDNAKIIGQKKVDEVSNVVNSLAAKEIKKQNDQSKNKGRKQ